MTPAQAASEAAARASGWIAVSPVITDVLDWHKGLCGTCQAGHRCPEYGEIITEYGAGPYGTAVFCPVA